MSTREQVDGLRRIIPLYVIGVFAGYTALSKRDSSKAISHCLKEETALPVST
jgi:hypothetical protein